MITIRGVYRNGTIQLAQPIADLPAQSDLIVSFANSMSNQVHFTYKRHSNSSTRGTRKFPRQAFQGSIALIKKKSEGTVINRLPILDISRGGISFASQQTYSEDTSISVGITNPEDRASVLLEFDLEVRGTAPHRSGFRIGCMFQNSLDEGLFLGLSKVIG